jgi:hypothetical protein
MNEKDRLQMVQRVMLELKGIKDPSMFIEPNPCQSGYIAYGTKELNGIIVPNCIPEKDTMSIVKEGFPIPSPSGESEDEFISKCMGNSTMVSDFPDQSQRAAVCYKAWRGE